MEGVTYPDVEVQLIGEDGNVFSIIGLVNRALRNAGHQHAAAAFTHAAMEQPSYDAVLRLVMRTVVVA